MKYIEWISIPIGSVALVLALFGHDIDSLTITAGALCLVYAAYLIYLWSRRPKFDWHLIHGRFLMKVVAFILLVPSLITSAYTIHNAIQSSKGCECYSPKNLVYEENLYDTDYKSDTGVAARKDPSIFWTIYLHFIDPGNQQIATSQSGRGWAALIAILGIFLLNGLLVSSIISWIDSRRDKWQKGEIKYPRFLSRNSHYVIIGGSDIVEGITRQLLPKGKYIVIQTSSSVESLRKALYSTLTEEEQKQIIIYYGNRTSPKDIEELHLERAEEVFIIGEETRTDDKESYHDTMNMKALDLAFNYLCQQEPYASRITEINATYDKIATISEQLHLASDHSKSELIAEQKRLKKLVKSLEKSANDSSAIYRVMFEYQTSFSVFQFSEISSHIKTCIKFKPFNYYEMWAQNVLICKEFDHKNHCKYLPLEGFEGIKATENKHVHLIIVGMSRMGVAMAIEAAHLAHYPNYNTQSKIRTKITFIDSNADIEKGFFMGRFKELFKLSHWRYGYADNDTLKWEAGHAPTDCEHLGGDFIDIEWEFICGGVESRCVQQYIDAVAKEQNSTTTVALCLPEPSRCLAAALYLDSSIYQSVSQILVYNRYGDSLISQMTHLTEMQMNPYHNKLRAFGMATECYNSKIITDAEQIAEMLNSQYDKLYEYIDEGQGLNKSEVAKWWSNIYAANSMWTKLRCTKWSAGCQLSDNQVDLLAHTEHARWNMEQLLLGYRPLSKTEQQLVIADMTQKNPMKSNLAHFDICSFEILKQIDPGSIRYDRGLTQILPIIYQKINENNA